MEQVKISLRKRLKRIGIFELVMFALSCGVHYIMYLYRGRFPFNTALQGLYFMAWPGVAIVMVYAAHALNKNPEVTSRQILAAAAIYTGLYAYMAVGFVTMLAFSNMPLGAVATGPLPWLLLRGWFSWLLLGGALKLVKVEKAAAQGAVIDPASNHG